MKLQPFNRAFCTLAAAGFLLFLFPVLQDLTPGLPSFAGPSPFFRQFMVAANPAPEFVVTDTSETEVPEEPAVPVYNGRDRLQPFYQTLRRGNEQVRIAHYGDSSIEGDLITASFRDSLQQRFGGSGIGFVPLVNPIAGFRRTLRHSFSPNWRHVYLGKTNAPGLPRGPSGAYVTTRTDSAQAAGDYWVSLGNTSLFAAGRSLPSARLFYGPPKGDSLLPAPTPGRVMVTASENAYEFSLAGKDPINEQVLIASPVRRLVLYFHTLPNQPLYGVSLESADGVIVDNFPSRGNTGAALTQIDRNLLSTFQQLVDYDLILLQFGLNNLNPKMEDYSWYTLEMVKVIHHLQESYKGAPILVLGPSDKAIKRDDRMQTDPSIPRITEALRQAAEQTHSAFFSFYEAMGGQGSMVKWVEDSQPPLANADYTHFNFDGGRRAALMLLDFLLEGYEQYVDTAEKEAHVLR